MNEVNDRIKLIIDKFYDKNVSAFARDLNIPQSTLSNILSGRKSKPSYEVLEKITTSIEVINPGWLLTGKGEMLIDSAETEAKLIESPQVMFVPMVSQYAYAGYLSGYGDPTYMETLPMVAFFVTHEAKGNYICIEVRGDSMNDGTEDSLVAGDRLLCREVEQMLWTSRLHINKWDFVIVHRTEGVLVKRIVNHDVEKGSIQIHSLNPEYEDQILFLKDIGKIFNIVEISRPRKR